MILSATNLAVIPDGIPVLGGAGKISVPFGDFLGLEIECGDPKAISKKFLAIDNEKDGTCHLFHLCGDTCDTTLLTQTS
jgi:hypothetical protein